GGSHEAIGQPYPLELHRRRVLPLVRAGGSAVTAPALAGGRGRARPYGPEPQAVRRGESGRPGGGDAGSHSLASGEGASGAVGALLYGNGADHPQRDVEVALEGALAGRVGRGPAHDGGAARVDDLRDGRHHYRRVGRL